MTVAEWSWKGTKPSWLPKFKKMPPDSLGTTLVQDLHIQHLHLQDRLRPATRRPIVVPFIHDHYLMLQHDNARPHVARICTQFLEAENIPVLAWPAYSVDISPIEHVWNALIGVYGSVFQFLPISSNFTQSLKRSGPTFHRPQSTTWSTLCEGDVFHCVRQMVVTPGHTPGPPQYSKTAHFRVAFYCDHPKAHLCNNHAV